MVAGMRKGRRIVVLCEGDTEELAIRHFLIRPWHAQGFTSVGLQPVNLHGRLQDVPVKTSLYLDDQDILGVFTLVDLYGMDRVHHLPHDTLDTKVRRVCGWLKDSVKHARSADFFPHVCVHETEAWLLAEGAVLAKRLSDPDIKPDPQAESKDFQRPPSKIINELFLKRRSGDRYQKIRDGRPLFASLEFEPVYRSCRYLSSSALPPYALRLCGENPLCDITPRHETSGKSRARHRRLAGHRAGHLPAPGRRGSARWW